MALTEKEVLQEKEIAESEIKKGRSAIAAGLDDPKWFFFLINRIDTLEQNLKFEVKDTKKELNSIISALDQKFENKFAALDQKFENKFADLDQKTENRAAAHDKKLDGLVKWAIGIIVTVIFGTISIVASLL